MHSANGVELVPKAKLSDADSMQFTKMLLTLTPHSNHLETIEANSDALSVAETAGVNISSNNAKTTITVSNVASAEIYEKILQNITFKSPINDNDPDGDFTDTRPISVVLTDRDSNPEFDESDGSLTYDNKASDTLTINVKVDPSPPAYVKNGLLTLSGGFSGTEPLKVSLPLKQVSSTSAGKIQLAEGSEYQSMIKAVNVNASALTNQGVIIDGTSDANILILVQIKLILFQEVVEKTRLMVVLEMTEFNMTKQPKQLLVELEL